MYRAVCKRGVVLAVGHHNNRSTLFIQFCQQIHHLSSVLGVQVTGRLIGEDYLRIADNGAGNGYTLLLTAGKLLREVFGTVADVHPLQNILYHAFALTCLHAEVRKGKFHILVDVQFVYQVEALEHESQLALAHTGTFLFLQVRYFLTEQLVTALRRIVQQPEDVQQGGLAAT